MEHEVKLFFDDDLRTSFPWQARTADHTEYGSTPEEALKEIGLALDRVAQRRRIDESDEAMLKELRKT